MKILRLQTQGFKRVTAVDITPADPLVTVRGDNAEGKSSLLDSIKAALGGADGAPLKPIRTGDDFAAIRIELGDGGPAIVVEKYFDEVGEKLRVTNADGAEYSKGQTTVAGLLGRMTFDPLAFGRMKPTDQAGELRRLVPLKVDLDQLAAADKADVAARRDVNRDAKALKVRFEAIEVSGIVPERPDREAIVARLSAAGETNAAIERERADRDNTLRVARSRSDHAGELRAKAHEHRVEAARLVGEAERLERSASADEADHDRLIDEHAALPPLDEPVDTAQLSADLVAADRDLALLARSDARKRLEEEFDGLRTRSEGYTAAIEARATERADALASAEMPVPGLSLARLCDAIPGAEGDDLIVLFEGEPFAQASGAQQLRVSMRLAMAANPKLRVMLIKEGSLLDGKGLDLVRELAAEGDYQVWLESVGEGDGSGIIMEAGAVRGAPEPERIEPPKRRRAKGDAPEEAKGPAVPAGDGEVNAGSPAALVEGRDGLSRSPASEPTRRKAQAMREFTSKPAGDLFGGGE
jgi:hypothetical protein